MTDLLRAFGPLQDEYYPGSKQKRRESKQMRHSRKVEERRQERDDEGWDARPIKKTVKGIPIEVFPIGSLGKALGRDSVTLRAWIRKGWLPRNSFQSPPVYGSRGDAGRRLWTRTQIEGIVQIAREEGLLEAHPPRVQATNFTRRVMEAWKIWRWR